MSACQMVFLGLLLAASGARAQEPFRVEGRIISSATGAPISGAIVLSDRGRAVTDVRGRFRLPLGLADSTTITVRRLGFEPLTFSMSTDSLALKEVDIELLPVAQQLDDVTLAERRSLRVPMLERFDERRRLLEGVGFFLTSDQIRQRDGMPLTSMLSQARGVTILRSREGDRILRLGRATQRLRPCAPHVWLDGIRADGFEVDDISSRDVEAIELYSTAASAPSEFVSGAALACGVLVIWTRRPALAKP